MNQTFHVYTYTLCDQSDKLQVNSSIASVKTTCSTSLDEQTVADLCHFQHNMDMDMEKKKLYQDFKRTCNQR